MNKALWTYVSSFLWTNAFLSLGSITIDLLNIELTRLLKQGCSQTGISKICCEDITGQTFFLSWETAENHVFWLRLGLHCMPFNSAGELFGTFSHIRWSHLALAATHQMAPINSLNPDSGTRLFLMLWASWKAAGISSLSQSVSILLHCRPTQSFCWAPVNDPQQWNLCPLNAVSEILPRFVILKPETWKH